MLSQNPIVTFTILLLVILTLPPLFERLRLPGLVGLLVAGIVLGGDGLKLLDPETETMKLLSDIGKVYLMFVAGLEIDLAEFKKHKDRSLGFGVATFLFPIITGTLVAKIFGLGWNGAILTGSLLASHTLLGYPIVQQLGVVGNQAVTVTIGATIFTDIAALLVLAICVSINAGNFSVISLTIQLGSLAIYSVVILWGFQWLGKQFFRRTTNQESNQFLFILLVVFIAALGATVINVDKIVGSFLAGLAVNDVVGKSLVKDKINFVGSVLFIPCFFVNMGLLLDISAFINTFLTSFELTLSIILGLLGSKFLAAFFAQKIYHYNWNETMSMWSLSMPQVAATLAAALVGVQVGILPETIFNSVIFLMLVTSILGPILTAKFASKLSLPEVDIESDQSLIWWETHQQIPEGFTEDVDENFNHNFVVLVPVYFSPLQTKYLIEMAAMLAKHEAGLVIPLSLVKGYLKMDSPQLNIALQQSYQRLNSVLDISKNFQIDTTPETRISDNFAKTISRTAREKNASLIVMSWGKNTGIKARLFGNIIDQVFYSAHCPVAVMRLLEEPINIHRILVPVKNITPQALRTVRFAQLFADTNQASVTILHVCDRQTPEAQINKFYSQLSQLISQGNTEVKSRIKIIRYDDVAPVISKAARAYQLVILRSMRRRTAGGLSVSDVTTKVLSEITCSVVIFGEPYS
ncbi:sodium:proton antiporter [Hydrocoleum sp. CS-953]|uniref:cation:proton antiporter n=2 Tax=Hydrocoleum sp. CS-953 TaxID=1671698 RepID=UPI000B9B38F8|nr:cation:proton antiporter [Hydrocoleum sp. CS-953]OZH55550.1 sodium:proton antiporter [Hydrocoleum sp. CS-953]